MDTNAINLISEYIKTPQGVYKDYLYKQIHTDDQMLKFLNVQENITSLTSSFKIPSMPYSCVKLIEPTLNKYHYFAKVMHFTTVLATVIIGSVIGFYFLFHNKAEVENAAPITQSFVSQVVAPEQVFTNNIFMMQKSNLSLLSFIDTVSGKLPNKETIQYSGDIKNYKTINEGTDMSDVLLDQAQVELASGVVDIEQLDSYLQRVVISQHDVEVLEGIDLFLGRDE
ncbi:MAG: hypothetical protein GY817_05045 [bacterium]|nr:hypothetical protein [bacterium]